MTDECPCYARFLQLVHADLSGEGAVGLVKHILGGDFDTLAEVFAGKKKVERRWGDDDLYTASTSASDC